jgi:hypothetical protein
MRIEYKSEPKCKISNLKFEKAADGGQMTFKKTAGGGQTKFEIVVGSNSAAK